MGNGKYLSKQTPQEIIILFQDAKALVIPINKTSDYSSVEQVILSEPSVRYGRFDYTTLAILYIRFEIDRIDNNKAYPFFVFSDAEQVIVLFDNNTKRTYEIVKNWELSEYGSQEYHPINCTKKLLFLCTTKFMA